MKRIFQVIKYLTIIILLIQIVSCQPQTNQSKKHAKHFQKLPTFYQFKDRFNKQYATEQQQNYRKNVYDQNVKEILHNTECEDCGVTIFTDKTLDQRKNQLFGLKTPQNFEQIMLENQHKVKSKLKLSNTVFPSSLDWRDKNVVTKVRNQKQCGACWAFQMIAVAQSLLLIQGKANVNTLDLAEQGLLQCTLVSSCAGGYPSKAAEQIIQGQGMYNQSRYPYRPTSYYKGNICSNSSKKDFPSPATSSSNYYGVSDQQIIQLLQSSPIGVTIDADSLSARYDPTINPIHKCKVSDNQINHGVMLVGYTPTYWIIKNSWGPKWGLDGYAYISRNRVKNENCVIHTWITVLQSNCSIPNCDKCVTANSCSACSAGYYLVKNATSNLYGCKPCLDSNCQTCYTKTQNSALEGRCKICKKGFILQVSTQKCKQNGGEVNINNCLVYSSDYQTCIFCDDTYVLKTDSKECLKCQVSNCEECIIGYTDRCKICKSGYKGQNCQAICSDKCIGGCTAPGTCAQCQSGYTGKNCQIIQCLPNCRKCLKPFTCDECDKGYKLPNCQFTGQQQPDQPGIKCNSYIKNCERGCSKSPDVCDQCNKGFYGPQCNIQYKCDSSGCRTIINTVYKKQQSTKQISQKSSQNLSRVEQIKRKVTQTLGISNDSQKQAGLTIGLVVMSILLTFSLVFLAFLIYRLRTIKRINIIQPMPLQSDGSNKSIPYVGKRVNNVSMQNI